MISSAQPADGLLHARTRHYQEACGVPCEGLSRDRPVTKWPPIGLLLHAADRVARSGSPVGVPDYAEWPNRESPVIVGSEGA